MHVDIAGVMENKDEVSYLSPGMAGEYILRFYSRTSHWIPSLLYHICTYICYAV